MPISTEDAEDAGASLNIDRDGRQLRIRFSGLWLLSSKRPDFFSVLGEIKAKKDVDEWVFETDRLSDWDSAFLSFVRALVDFAKEKSIAVSLKELPEQARTLIELSFVVPKNRLPANYNEDDFYTGVGTRFIRLSSAVLAYFDFIGQLLIDFFSLLRGRSSLRYKDFLLLLQETGPRALPIVGLLSFLTGLIIAFIGVIQLQKFGADIYVADLVGLATTRELGAVMSGVIMAGRTGAAFAAQIGSMRVNEEVDALISFGISPSQFLVLPRVLALVLVMPLLCAWADVVAIAGGMVVGFLVADVSMLQYINQVEAAVSLSDLLGGLLKSVVFGVIIAVAGCHRGLNCAKDTSAVGLAATSAVVTAITWIVLADAVFAVIFNLLGI